MMLNSLVLRKRPHTCPTIALLRSKVAISFKPKQRHHRDIGQKRLNVAKLTSKDTQLLLGTNISAALANLKKEGYGSTSEQWDGIRTSVLKAAETTVGFVCKKNKDWFDENNTSVSSILSSLHTLHLAYVSDKTSTEKKNRYKRARQVAQAKLREMKNKWWSERTKLLQASADSHDAKTFHNEIKAVYGPLSRGTCPLFAVDGETLIKEPSLILARWAEHFSQLLNRDSRILEDAIDEITQRPIIDELDNVPVVAETVKAINQLSSGKAPGDDGIPNMGCGFRTGRGTTDMMFSARQMQEKCREQNLDLFMVFIDLTKAFDSINREGLWKILLKLGCPPRMVNRKLVHHKIVPRGASVNPNLGLYYCYFTKKN
ncbi:hypothetical protein AC249_AIPGENE24837 [Exaiptasia diaphana]|nr:hypothetical protein AC249_AIPGENE24837 [Exaiptasia diaphana]